MSTPAKPGNESGGLPTKVARTQSNALRDHGSAQDGFTCRISVLRPPS
jgi:hypothetical protein